MLKINKIQDKNTIEVLAQGKNDCTRRDKPIYYYDSQSCLYDCTNILKPKYWQSTHT